VLEGRSSESAPAGPRYLGLPGRKPLLGWDAANQDLRRVCLVEGPADLLALKHLGVAALALCGTHVAGATLESLGRWARLYVVFDEDLAGQEATARLIRSFRDRVIPVRLPAGVNDPADLAARPDGAALFRTAIRQAVQRWRCPGQRGIDDRT
jgi:DNA primase